MYPIVVASVLSHYGMPYEIALAYGWIAVYANAYDSSFGGLSFILLPIFNRKSIFREKMQKVKTAFFCKHCGAHYSKWQGQCHACKEWNTIIEEVLHKPKNEAWEAPNNSQPNVPIPIAEVSENPQVRLATGDAELDRVLGGGIVPGSLVLLAGEPGIGKSTLLLQLALQVNYPTLYVSGEESLTQIKLRSSRMNNGNPQCFLLNETNVEQILNQANKLKPKLLIVDSIQTFQTDLIDSGAGSVTQVRECTSTLQHFPNKCLSRFVVTVLPKTDNCRA